MINITLVSKPNFNINIRPSKANLRNLALKIRKIMLDRTLAGKSVDGRGFKKYSAIYRDMKARQMTARGNPDHVNLMFTGAMLRSMAVHSEERYSDIFFSDAERAEIAYYHNEGYGVPKREFFGLSDSEETKAFNDFYDEYWKRVEKDWIK